MKFRKKPVVIDAEQWSVNGDHSQDNCYMVKGGSAGEFLSEGEVVRYYRNPEDSGDRKCQHCEKTMHAHGWIDTLEGGHIVCPGDFIITGVNGEKYPCKPDIFAKTYELVELPAATSTNSSTIPDRWVMATDHSEEALLDNVPGAAPAPAKWRCQCPMCEHHRTAAAIIDAEGQG